MYNLVKHKKIPTIILKIGLLLVLTFYISSVSFFYHTHDFGDIVIVHSHPYEKGCDGKPSHTHTNSEIQLIHILSNLDVTVSIFTLLILLTFFFRSQILLINKDVAVEKYSIHRQSYLRPPPVCFNHYLSVGYNS